MLVMCASTLVKVLNHYSGIFYDKLRVNPADKLSEKGNIPVKKKEIYCNAHILFIFISVIHLIYISMTFLSLTGLKNALKMKNLQNFHVFTSML